MREDERLSPALWGVLTLLFLALFINYIDRGALSIAAPIIKEQFGMSPGKLGVLLSAFFWTYASFLLISGWLADRFEAGYVLAAGFFVWSLATLFTGVAWVSSDEAAFNFIRTGWLLAFAILCSWFATRAFTTYQRSV